MITGRLEKGKLKVGQEVVEVVMLREIREAVHQVTFQLGVSFNVLMEIFGRRMMEELVRSDRVVRVLQ